ncbi:MAG: Fic family protein [bacterium]|nr:Fic family protein [bacterium]
MIKLSPREQKIIGIFFKTEKMRSSGIYDALVKSGEKISLVTVKRALSKLAEEKILTAAGFGRSLAYSISPAGRVLAEVDAHAYCSIEPDKRYGLKRYNFDLFSAWPPDIFTGDELTVLNNASAEYKIRTKQLPVAIQKKELERLIIELSWKSSKIEGNTYTLLDTEKLILENKQAAGHDKKEARMILNHKDAFNFVRANAARFRTITRKNLKELHAILAKNLSVGLGLRAKPVGVVGSIYRPLDNIYQIAEVINVLGGVVSRLPTPYGKALVALLGIGYIQPFEDGNKRTSRLMANAILLAHGLAPLSYRSIDETEYREAMLAFYELNSAMPFKKIFIEQYDFAARNYAVK